MIRHTMRALCAATLVIAPVALTATPAHAVTSCRVNGVPVTGTSVIGTPNADYITCGSVGSGDLIRGEGGADYIVVTGTVAGAVRGNTGGDFIRVDGTVAPGGAVDGGDGNDFLRVATNGGTVDGGTGIDYCRVVSGAPPVNCES
ncbi:hypothetical protein ACWD5B_26590 [Streptomyces tanashiensis]|uniref:Uncharacterized protein n=1 Tax=Streptomyces tanashiensis TaxID=67367 RepID=A0ABY6QV20_9ACTN|nr:hypothetical protein [Streptomyces tanashiensis]UZX21046.1 hypothetical protein LDH80_10105 [Streptomyces tanashiensis]